MDDYLIEAYEQICSQAKNPSYRWVSLYRSDRCYGGPEEGGWYYTLSVLISSQRFDSTIAEEIRNRVEEKAKELNTIARREWSVRCGDLDEMEEPLDPYECPIERSYFVVVEDIRGSQEQSYRPRYE